MKEFKASSWSIDNKTTIYVLALFISIAGFFAYQKAPKEQFPEIVFPHFIATLAVRENQEICSEYMET